MLSLSLRELELQLMFQQWIPAYSLFFGSLYATPELSRPTITKGKLGATLASTP